MSAEREVSIAFSASSLEGFTGNSSTLHLASRSFSIGGRLEESILPESRSTRDGSRRRRRRFSSLI